MHLAKAVDACVTKYGNSLMMDILWILKPPHIVLDILKHLKMEIP